MRNRSASTTRSPPGSAHAIARDEIDDGEEDHRAQERNQQTANADDARIDGRRAEQRAQQPTTQNGTHDTHDDVQDDSLTTVASHHDAGQPAHDSTDYQPQNDSHRYLLF